MRWKLLIAASLLATLAGAGAALAVTYFAPGPASAAAAPAGFLAVSLLVPLAAITFAAVFVYRHTARRRSLQAAATALLAALLTLSALLFLPRLLVPRPAPPTDMPPTKNVGQLEKR